MEPTREQSGDERSDRPRKVKKPRKVTARSLENVALHYLKRYAASVAQLKRVLVRRVDRSLRVHGGDRAEAMVWIEELVAKLARGGLINDDAYASMKARSLRSSGKSARTIAQTLRVKGIDSDLVHAKLAETTSSIPELEAARIWARKKRLGPFRRDVSTRKDRRQRDLAAMARAGFPFDIAKKVIDGSVD